jgi:hypothetical protein
MAIRRPRRAEVLDFSFAMPFAFTIQSVGKIPLAASGTNVNPPSISAKRMRIR